MEKVLKREGKTYIIKSERIEFMNINLENEDNKDDK